METVVKKLAVALLLMLTACPKTHGYDGPKASASTGAASPRSAVDGFLAAVHSQDLQAMSGYWGSEKGPAREALARDVLERRELIMQCYLSHDR